LPATSPPTPKANPPTKKTPPQFPNPQCRLSHQHPLSHQELHNPEQHIPSPFEIPSISAMVLSNPNPVTNSRVHDFA
jgi:hypothetical protein